MNNTRILDIGVQFSLLQSNLMVKSISLDDNVYVSDVFVWMFWLVCSCIFTSITELNGYGGST